MNCMTPVTVLARNYSTPEATGGKTWISDAVTHQDGGVMPRRELSSPGILELRVDGREEPSSGTGGASSETSTFAFEQTEEVCISWG